MVSRRMRWTSSWSSLIRTRSWLLNGVIARGSNARVIRDGVVTWDGEIDSIRHLKDEVKEIKEGFECGIVLKGFSDLEEGDVLEAYVSKSVERTEL